MKSFLFYVLDLILATLLMPLILRDYLHARSAEAKANEILASAQVASHLWAMGTDFRPLARNIVSRLHTVYGVAPSKVAPGHLVNLHGDRSDA